MGLYKGLFHVLSFVGRPIGGVRPRRIYDAIGRKAWPKPDYRWHRNCWGDELWISPHQHFDRCVMAFGCYDPDLHMALEHLLRPGMICLDVGANFGELSLHMARKVGHAGLVHSFEPAPGPFARLSRHAERNGHRIQCHQLALGDRCGVVEMAVPTEMADNQGLGSVVGDALPDAYTKASVKLMTLDAFADQCGLRQLDFIKLDIQGGEPLLVQGGVGTIRRFMPLIVSELSPRDLAATGYNSRTYCELLTGLGYAVCGLSQRGIGAAIPAVSETLDATNVVFVPPGHVSHRYA